MKKLKVKNEYLEFRKSFFEAIKLRAKSTAFVNAALVDIRVNNEILTLVSYASGRNEIYVSNKAGLINVGGQYETVKRVTVSYLSKAEKLLNSFTKTTEFDLDKNALENVFIFTKDGIYNLKITEGMEIDGKSSVAFLRFLYKRVLSEFINARSYSCMTHKCRKCLFGNFLGGCMIKKIIQGKGKEKHEGKKQGKA